MSEKRKAISLSRLQATPINTDRIKYEGWHNDGILVIKSDDSRLSWPEKEFIKQIGNKIYPKKGGKNAR